MWTLFDGGGGMPTMTWSSYFFVGVEMLDIQHRRLFDIMDELDVAMKDGRADGVSERLIEELLEYSRDHFSTEENMMRKSKYAGFARHRDLHTELTGQVREYLAREQGGDRAVHTELLGFLREWLAQHIQKEDRAFGVWLNAHGVS